MFPMTLTIHNPAQLNAVLAAMGSDLPESVTRPATTPEQTLVDKAEANVKVKKETQADPKPTAAQTEQPAASQPTAEAVAADVPDQKELNYKDDIQRRVLACVKAGKRTEILATLAEFKVDHAEKLTPAQWPDFIVAADKLLGA